MRGRVRGAEQIRSNVPILEHMGLLAGGIRLELLASLADSPKDVSTLADELGLALNYVSQALRLLREYGLVEVRRHHKHRIHHLSGRVRASLRNNIARLAITGVNGQVFLVQTPVPGRSNSGPFIPQIGELLDLAHAWLVTGVG